MRRIPSSGRLANAQSRALTYVVQARLPVAPRIWHLRASQTGVVTKKSWFCWR